MIAKVSIISFLLKIILTKESYKEYSFQTDISINLTSIDSALLIGYYTLRSKINCLALCNSIKSCYSAVYNKESKTHQCSLYSKYFSSNELVPLKNAIFFSKEASKECKELVINFGNFITGILRQLNLFYWGAIQKIS